MSMARFALGVLLGDAVQMQQPELSALGSYLLTAALGVLALLAARRRPWLLLLGAALAAYGTTGWRAQARLADRLAPALWGGELTLRGSVAELPQWTAHGCRFVFAPRPPTPHGVPRRLLASWAHAPGAPCAVRGGELWRLRMRLVPLHGLANPGGSDAELWAFAQRLGGRATVLGGARERAGRGLVATRERLRQRLHEALSGSAQLGAVAALALGEQSALDATAWALYRDTGVAHLFSISGLHIALLAALAGALAAALWRRASAFGRPCALWLATPLLAARVRVLAALLYAVLAGFGVPAQRALLMLTAVALALRGGVRSDWREVLCWALAAVLLWEPWALPQPGAWLSFGAVAALCLGAVRAAHGEPVRGLAVRVLARLRQAAGAQFAVCTALLPLTLVFFQQIAWVAPLANALAIPLTTLGVVPLALLGLALPAPLDAAAWHAAAWMLDALQPWLRWLGGWPRWSAPAPSPAALAFAAPGVVALLLPWGWRLRVPGVALLLPLLAGPAPSPQRAHLEAWLADVGQGSAVLLRTAHHALLFDSGPPGSGSRVLLPLLRARGVGAPDVLLLSHGDSDHVGGAAELTRLWPRMRLLRSPGDANSYGLTRTGDCRAGQRWNWDGVRFQVLHPPAGARSSRSNALSCVLLVRAAGGSVLLTGDIERAQERELIARAGDDVRADLLVVPHHGSRGASSEALLRAVAPRVAAVQSGWRNRYGHPHRQTLQRYAAQAIELHRTDREGALRWHDAEPAMLRGWRAAHPHYWRPAIRGVP